VELSELSDSKSVFNLNYANEDVSLNFTKFTLGKVDQLCEYYGGFEKLQRIMGTASPRDLCYIAWCLMDKDSKKKLFNPKFKFTDVNDDGEEVEIYKKGHEKLMALLDLGTGFQSLAEMITASFNQSMPEPKKGAEKGKK
jgi:hypothetical protein